MDGEVVQFLEVYFCVRLTFSISAPEDLAGETFFLGQDKRADRDTQGQGFLTSGPESWGGMEGEGTAGMSGKIAHLSNRQTSDFRKQLKKNSQSGQTENEKQDIRTGHGIRDGLACLVVVRWYGGGSHVNATTAATPSRQFLLFVHVNCFCEAIENFQIQPKKREEKSRKKKGRSNKLRRLGLGQA